jgi:hypothetical protein
MKLRVTSMQPAIGEPRTVVTCAQSRDATDIRSKPRAATVDATLPGTNVRLWREADLEVRKPCRERPEGRHSPTCHLPARDKSGAIPEPLGLLRPCDKIMPP